MRGRVGRLILLFVQLTIALLLILGGDSKGARWFNRGLKGLTSQKLVFTVLALAVLPLMKLNRKPDEDGNVRSDQPIGVAIANNALALVIAFYMVVKLLVMQPTCLTDSGFLDNFKCVIPAVIIPFVYVTFVRSWNRSCITWSLKKKNRSITPPDPKPTPTPTPTPAKPDPKPKPTPKPDPKPKPTPTPTPPKPDPKPKPTPTPPKPDPEISNKCPCTNNLICDNGKCVECSRKKHCKGGKICKSNKCIDPTTQKPSNENQSRNRVNIIVGSVIGTVALGALFYYGYKWNSKRPKSVQLLQYTSQ